MQPADFETHYYIGGLPVEPSAQTLKDLEDGYDDLWDAFLTQDGLVVDTRCTADGSPVRASLLGDGQGMGCSQGHRWLHVAPEPLIAGSTWGWRQIR